MLDIKFIRENLNIVKEEIKKRGMKIDLDSFLDLDEQKRELQQEVENLRKKQNEANKTISQSKDKKIISKMKEVKLKLSELEPRLKNLEKKLKDISLQLPNITHESVPVGSDELGNVVVKKWGEKPKFDFSPKEHFEIESVKNLIDTKRGAKVSGTRFWYLKGDLARLEFALMQYALEFYSNKGFEPMIVPMLVREPAMYGTGFFPAEKNEIYNVNADEDNLFLVGTAEVPLAAYHMNEVLDLENGPKKYMGYSSCFRREAGTYGKDIKGILRGHQFNKIEMFIFCKPEESWNLHEELLKYAEEFLQSLNLHYQVLNMCTGDIGAPNAKKYDIETWIPGQNKYRETHSCSNDTDFQARRLNCKFTDKDGKKKFVHTLNNTGCADLRVLIAILENYQQKNGTIIVPEVLRKWIGKDVIE
ncbi:serine--tRNA ligase [Candidatus Parcubacteria bacterium]|nr:serine--tRNA ligase [Candidatus Parcubacteria bacterium]